MWYIPVLANTEEVILKSGKSHSFLFEFDIEVV